MNQSNQTLFDNLTRTDGSPKRNLEDYFSFYNRCASAVGENVRKLLDSMLSSYPINDSYELVARIRSKDDNNFKSAIFELCVHDALVKAGCKLIPHPDMGKESAKKPDFLVITARQQEFYLEATLANESNEEDPGAKARINAVLDVLSKNPHERFIVSLEHQGRPATQPSGNRMVRDIHNWLDSLDGDELRKELESKGFDSLPFLIWNHENWLVTITAIPLRAERRGKSQNLIGAGFTESGWVDSWSPIRKAIRNKASRYGVIGKPYIIAINVGTSHLDRIDEMQALFGQEQFIFSRDNPGGEPEMIRATNGAWVGPQEPQNTRTSGVWIFNNLRVSNLAVTKQTIYFNPWASYSLPELLKMFPHAYPENGKMCWEGGASFKEILDLRDGWPE